MNHLHRAGGQRAIADCALSSAGVASPSELAGGLMRRAMDPSDRCGGGQHLAG